MATFCERLRFIRKLNNVTLEKLAEDLGTTKATLSRYENGLRDPKSEVVNQLSEYFKVSSDYLLGKTDNPNKIILDKQPSIDYIKVAKKAESYGIPAKSLEEFIELVKNSVVVKE